MRNIWCFLFFLCISGCTKTVIPDAPAELNATVVSTRAVHLTWTDRSANETGFKIQRKTGSGSFAEIATLQKDIAAYSDTGLIPNTTYTYRVFAYNSAGLSAAQSNEVSVTTVLLPAITTAAVNSISNISAKGGGIVVDDGGTPVVARGIVWSTTPAPTIDLYSKTSDSAGTGSFTSQFYRLQKNTTYYVRAYATNALGTAYGSELIFKTTDIDITSELMAHYPFTGNTYDESGLGNHGGEVGVYLTHDRFGMGNSAYYFGGLDYIGVGFPFSEIRNVSEFTYALWFQAERMPAIDSVFNLLGSDMDVSSVLLGLNHRGEIVFSGNYDNPTVHFSIASAPGTIQHGRWYHLAMTFNKGTVQIFLNGSLIRTGVIPISLFDFKEHNKGQTLGTRYSKSKGFRDYFTGTMDEIRIYNRALTQEQIQYLYQFH